MTYRENPLTAEQKKEIAKKLRDTYRGSRFLAVIRFESIVSHVTAKAAPGECSAGPMIYIIDLHNADYVMEIANNPKPLGVARYRMRPFITCSTGTGQEYSELCDTILNLMDSNIPNWEKYQARGRYVELQMEELPHHHIGAYTYPLIIGRDGEAVLTGEPTEV